MEILYAGHSITGLVTTFLFLAVAAFLGMTLSWRLLRGAFFVGERVLLGMVLGLSLLTAVVLVSSLVAEFSTTVLWVDAALMLSIAVAVLRVSSLSPGRQTLEVKRTRTILGKTDALGLGVFVCSVAVFSLLMSRLIIWRQEGLFTGYIDAWGDLPFHLSLITSFCSSTALGLRSTILAGQPLTYPFLSDFFSAILMRTGLSLEHAVEWPGILLNSTTLTLLYYLSYRLVRNHKAALLAPLLFILSGGFGFFWFLRDVWLAPQPIWDLLLHLPHRYTNMPEVKIHWVNATLAHLIPQRSFLFGFPMGLSVILLWWNSFRKGRFENAWAVGMLVGMLPLCHAHTFLTLMLLAACLFCYTLFSRQWRQNRLHSWLLFGAFVLILAVPQVWFILASKVSLGGIRYHPGWMADSQNVVWFWLKNLGLFIPLLLAAILMRNRLRLRKRALLFFLPFALLFLAGNLFLFAPFAYDNNKVLVFWYLLSLPFVSRFLLFLRQSESWWVRAAAFRVLLLGLVFSGALNLVHELQGGGWRELSAEEVSLARKVKNNTQPDDVFLTAPVHNNFLTLAGRAVYMGYSGHIYSHGLDYMPFEKTVEKIYSGQAGAQEMLSGTAIDYVVVGPTERDEFGEHVEWFAGHYPLAFSSANYRVYRIKEDDCSNQAVSLTE